MRAVTEEMSNICSMYFESEIRTRRTQPPRNDDGGDSNVSDRLSIFKCPRRAFGYSSTRTLEDRELVATEIYIFMNCAELDPYIKEFESDILQQNPHLTDVQVEKKWEKSFATWLRYRVEQDFITDPRVQEINYGTSKIVLVYPGNIVNGY
ncbi:hypothetical protein Taro_032096 [Colocasia esculenta]|uniref:Uncharacterized protein n=1 Tax=Colocasia esculenta TaxID=4460 RepID=A0A843VKH3_COLES|nr:hypothetical protein [Colocasia esculenta]